MTSRALHLGWGLTLLAASMAALAANAGTAPAREAQAGAARRPNIVVLVADDWGFSDVGAFGGEIATPNLDLLAYQGVRFSNFHVAASCAPTRAMLMTGVDNHRNGVGNLRETMPAEHVGRPGYQGTLNTRVVTVASLLQDSGYRTYITGKWNLGSEPYNLPNQRGFDKSIVQGDTGSDNWEPSRRYLPHLPEVYWFEDGQRAHMPSDYYSSTYFVDRMLDYIAKDTRQNQPFFAYLGFQANHVPLQAPVSFIRKYKGRYQQGWTALREARMKRAAELGLTPSPTAMVTMGTTTDWDRLSPNERRHMEKEMEVYAGMAEAMDFEVGRLVTHLKDTGQFDNTVFVFLSDNGPEGSDYHEAQLWLKTQYSQDTSTLGAKGTYGITGPGWASASASPLATYKFYAGEGGIRTPLFIAGGRRTRSQQISSALTHVTDIAPTLLDLAQVESPGTRYRNQSVEPMVGHSLLPILQGAADTVRRPDEVLGYELSGNRALFRGTLKLVNNMPPVGDGQWHLYDLRNDPGETKDLRAERIQDFQSMQTAYAQYARDNGVLAIPEGYNPQRQVLLNSIERYWWPHYRGLILGVLAALLAGLGWWWRRRRVERPS